MSGGGRRSRLPNLNLSRRASLLALLLLTFLVVLACYHFTRTLAVNIGVLGDTAFLSRDGFHADELDLGYRYRWTKGHAEVHFPGAGSAPAMNVDVRAQGPRPEDSTRPVTMSVALNGTLLPRLQDPSFATTITLSPTISLYKYGVDGVARTGPPHTVAIDTSTFRPAGDARDLGAKIDFVVLRQSGGGLNLPPLWMLFWSLVLVAGVFGLLTWLRPLLSLALTLFVVMLFGLLLVTRPLYVAAYVPPLAAAAGLLGLLVWQRDRVSRWPERVELLGRWRVAASVMGAAMLVYAAIALGTLPQVDWIGHADYAENAVIARNLVQGKGFTVDYIAQFYKEHGPSISHPADTWPLLQPVMIAPFFALFGPLTWAAKLPNLFVLLGLAWAVFALASRLWDARVGLFAGLLTLVHPYFFNSVLYPINDLGFTLIFFLLAWGVWQLLDKTDDGRWRADVQPVIMGVLAGLLIWSKPSGAVLLVGVGLWAFWVWRGARRGAFPWRWLVVAGAAAGVVLLPLVVRNLLAFGVPFFTTESYDAWLLRYWPLHDWEDIYKVYIGSPDPPHPRWVVGGKFGYQNLVDAVLLNFRWVWEKGVLGSPGQGDYVFGLLPLAGALVGLAAATPRVKSLYAIVGLSICLYGLFVLFYWHYEGRYFQVAVPWLYMLLASGVFWVWDALRFWSPGGHPDFGRWITSSRERIQNPKSKIQNILLPVAVVGFLWPSLTTISEQIQSDTARTGFVTAMEWLRANSDEQDVVMTRDPWELNWYVERKAVMIPNDDLRTIEETMRKYGVTMLQLGGPVDGINVRSCPNAVGSRPALDGLYCGEERPGYDLVYREGGLTIYRLDE